jgi:molybdate transport system substrate-binding protein
MALRFLQHLLAAVLMMTSGACIGDVIQVAAASNFRSALSVLASRYERISGHTVVLNFGSTGKHYAQIIHGAPFDTFFAADTERPARLEDNGMAVPGSRFTYARGQLVLFRPGRHESRLDKTYLQSGKFRHLAIANPDLAPYGRAAKEVLESLGLWATLDRRVVRGENISQAYQFVMSGNAEAGFVARAQLPGNKKLSPVNHWLIPPALHQPIDQQAVLLKDTPAARDFMLYVRSDEAITVILDHGYLKP